MKPVTQAETFFLQGVEGARQFKAHLRNIKTIAFDSGLLFASAKQIAAHGEWEDLVKTHGQDVCLRTVQRYMKFAHDCLLWAKEQNPRVANQRQLQSYARDMVLESALSFMELCREVGAIKARAGEGARDGKSEERQLNFHFNFDAFDGLLLAVEQTGSNPFLTVDKTELQQSRLRLAKAVQLMDEALNLTLNPNLNSPEKILPLESGPSPTGI
jgi:hypothetical protein